MDDFIVLKQGFIRYYPMGSPLLLTIIITLITTNTTKLPDKTICDGLENKINQT